MPSILRRHWRWPCGPSIDLRAYSFNNVAIGRYNGEASRQWRTDLGLLPSLCRKKIPYMGMLMTNRVRKNRFCNGETRLRWKRCIPGGWPTFMWRGLSPSLAGTRGSTPPSEKGGVRGGGGDNGFSDRSDAKFGCWSCEILYRMWVEVGCRIGDPFSVVIYPPTVVTAATDCAGGVPMFLLNELVF